MDKIKELEKQLNKEAKAFAEKLFNDHYTIIFDSDTDKGEECLVSILAIKSALVTVKYMKRCAKSKAEVFYFQLVENILQKM